MSLRPDKTWGAALLVGAVLVGSLAVTGAASSAYRRARATLGRAHFAAAQALEVQSQAPGAIEQYRKALLFSPDDPQYRLALANALLEAGRLDEAQAHLEQLAEDNPTEPRIYVDLARIAAARHQTPQAIRAYQRAVYEYWPADQIPRRRAARWELVNLLGASGRRTEAVGELMQLYASAPADPAERERIARRLLEDGATSEAGRIFAETVKLAPQNVGAHRGLAQVRFAMGDYVAARHEFSRAVRLDSNDRQSSAGLALSNEVIEIDPLLPGISGAERDRRSQNLLRQVMKDLGNCPGADLGAAQKLLCTRARRDTDPGSVWQEAAQELCSQRSSVCGQSPPGDEAVSLVMGSMRGENAGGSAGE